MRFAQDLSMRFSQQLGRYSSRRATRRLMRELPWIGGAIVLLAVGRAIRKKGVLGGTLHTALDFTPFVGVIKNVAELVRGRDFFPDKPLTVPPASRR
jgi:hypothetical protein